MPTNKVVKVNSAATTNVTSVKVGTTVLFSLSMSNLVATANFVKLFDQVASPTLGTDRPVLVVPTTTTVGQLTVLDFGPGGVRYDNGLWLAIVSGTGIDTDSGAVAVANGIKVILSYK